MKKGTLKRISIITVLIVLLITSVAAYILRPTVAPSGEIVAVPIKISTELPQEIEIATSTTQTLISPESTDVEDKLSDPIIFSIQQTSSQASFTLDEVLRGVDTTVIGVTNQVAAQILLNFNEPASSQIGIVTINARTLRTNSENRNRALRNEILDVDEYEFISFEPVALIGLPETIEIGKSYEIEIIGNLTIRHIINEVSFIATINIESNTQISGTASTIIQRGAFELTIPRVPNVAGVSEDVLLAIDFVALAN